MKSQIGIENKNMEKGKQIEWVTDKSMGITIMNTTE